MNYEILVVVFECENWFPCKTTRFKSHCLLFFPLKIDTNFQSFKEKTIIALKLSHEFNLRDSFYREDENKFNNFHGYVDS